MLSGREPETTICINKSKEENEKLQSTVKDFKNEKINFMKEIKSYKTTDLKLKKTTAENKELKMKIEAMMKEHYRMLKLKKNHGSENGEDGTSKNQSIDLDMIGITSDQYRLDGKKYTKGVDCKGHPLVPKLDFEKIYRWREQQDADETQEDLEEEEEEEELLTENQKFMFKGSSLHTHASVSRKNELEQRKDDVIAILNKTYTEEEPEVGLDLDSFKEEGVVFHDIDSDFQ